MEVWRVIDEAPRYLISSKGRVKNSITGKILSSWLVGNGYLYTNLTVNGKHLGRYIHRLVLAAFSDKDYTNLEGNHRDGIKTNNDINNLEWVTSSDNKFHAFQTGLRKPLPGTLIRVIETDEIFESQMACARALGLDQGNIFGVLSGRLKHYKGYTFEYVD